MQTIYVSYMILSTINVPDGCSDDEIQDAVEGHAMDLGFHQFVHAIEWERDE